MTTRTALLFALLATAATGWLLTPGTAAEAPALPRAAHFHKSATTKPSTAVAQRIVSLAPVITETLFALGAGERVVGVTRYCDRPAAARELPKVGGFIDPQLEAILALEPDLVLAMPSKGVRTTLDRLREHHIPVLVGFGDTIDEIRDLIASVGDAVGTGARAAELIDAFDAALAQQRRPSTASSPRILVLVGARPLIAAGPGTFADEAVRWIGGRRALADTAPAWPNLTLEAIGTLAPDLIVAAGGPVDAEALAHVLAPLDGKRPPIVHGDDALLMRPGPTLHHDIAQLAKLLPSASGAPR